MNLDEFLDSWDAYVRRWTDAGPDEQEELTTELLARGLSLAAAPRERPTVDETLACELDVVRRAGAVDVPLFREKNSFWKDIKKGPRAVFCREAWQFLRNPSPDFDVWWYWGEYLDPARETVNPLVHFLAHGQFVGNSPLPSGPSRSLQPARRSGAPEGVPLRRV